MDIHAKIEQRLTVMMSVMLKLRCHRTGSLQAPTRVDVVHPRAALGGRVLCGARV